MMKRARIHCAIVAAAGLSMAAGVCEVSATMYECGGKTGPRIFTDSPAQLENCVPLGGPNSSGANVGGANYAVPAAPPPYSTVPPPPVMPANAGQPVDLDKPPSYFPQPMPLPPGAPPAPDREIGLPASPPEPHAAATPEATGPQRCASSINPFNPLMTTPCPPSGTHAQAPVPEEQSKPLYPHEIMPPPQAEGLPPLPPLP